MENYLKIIGTKCCFQKFNNCYFENNLFSKKVSNFEIKATNDLNVKYMTIFKVNYKIEEEMLIYFEIKSQYCESKSQ